MSSFLTSQSVFKRRHHQTVSVLFNFHSKIEESVEISKEIFKQLWPQDDPETPTTQKYISIKLLGSELLTDFLVFKLGKIGETVGSNTITLMLSQDKFKHLEKCSINKALIYEVNPINIEHTIISVKDKKIYDQLHDSTINYPDVESSFVIRENDTVNFKELGFVGKIISNEPLSQGLLTNETRFTVVFNEGKKEEGEGNADDEDQVDEAKEILSRDDNIKEENFENDSDATETSLLELLNENKLSLDDFLSKSLILEESGEDLMEDSLLSESNQAEFLNIPIKPLHSKLSYFTPEPSKFEDHEIFVYLSVSNLLDLKYFSGDYAFITVDGDDSKKYKVKLISLVEPNDFIENTAYVSSIFFINLGYPKSIIIESNSNADKHFKVAKEVLITKIPSPVSLNGIYEPFVMRILKEYLKKSHRVVTRGYLIPVKIDTLLARSLFLTREGNTTIPPLFPEGDPNEIAWFQVSSIDGKSTDSSNKVEQFILLPDKARIVQSGIAELPLPSIEESNYYDYLELPKFFKFSKVIKERKRYEVMINNNDKVKVFEYVSKLENLIKTSLFNGDNSGNLNINICVLLHSLTRFIGKSTIIKNLALELGTNFIEISSHEILASPGSDLKMIGIIQGKLEEIIKACTSPLIVYFKHIDILSNSEPVTDNNSKKKTFDVKFIEMIKKFFKLNSKVIFVASTNNLDKLSNEMKNLFNYSIEVTVPNEIERQEIYKYYLEKTNDSRKRSVESIQNQKFAFQLNKQISIESLSLQSAGLNPIDIAAIIRSSKRSAFSRYFEEIVVKSDKLELVDLVLANNGCLSYAINDFEVAINNARDTFSESIGAPKIPNVKWEDVGGLELIKGEILDTIEMPLKNPYLFNNGLKKRSGILFYGPPGTGKTLLAKAIATNFSLNFFSVKGPELLNMYIGESEANVRKVFQKARDARPCVVFFDELDSVAPKRGNQGDSGGVMDRIVSQLLSELDGMSDGDDGDGVFVVGATNRPDLLDEALLRPGRFDKMLYLGISDTHEKQLNIIKALTRKFNLDVDVNLERLVSNLRFNYTGADFYALSSDAMLNAMTRKAKETDSKIRIFNDNLPEGHKKVNTRWWFDNVATKEDIEISVKQEDFIKSRNELIPSVSEEELLHYLKVRESFEGGKKKAKELTDSANGDKLVNGNQKDISMNGSKPLTGLSNGMSSAYNYPNVEDGDDDDLYSDASGGLTGSPVVDNNDSESTTSNGKEKLSY